MSRSTCNLSFLFFTACYLRGRWSYLLWNWDLVSFWNSWWGNLEALWKPRQTVLTRSHPFVCWMHQGHCKGVLLLRLHSLSLQRCQLVKFSIIFLVIFPVYQPPKEACFVFFFIIISLTLSEQQLYLSPIFSEFPHGNPECGIGSI